MLEDFIKDADAYQGCLVSSHQEGFESLTGGAHDPKILEVHFELQVRKCSFGGCG